MHRAAIIDLEGKEVRGLPEQLADAGGHPWRYSPDGKLLYRVLPWESCLWALDLRTPKSECYQVHLPGDASLGSAVVWSPAGISWLPPGDRLPFGPTPSPTQTPGPTRTRMPSRTPAPTQKVDYGLLAWQNLYWDALRPIFFDSAFQRDLQEAASILHSDPYIRTHFPQSGIEVFQGMTFIWGVELNAEDFYEIPLEETCSFVQRHYKRYGWPDQPDRNLVLVHLVETLGNPDSVSEYPYCANFDPAQNSDLGLLPTVTPTRRPTGTPADPGL